MDQLAIDTQYDIDPRFGNWQSRVGMGIHRKSAGQYTEVGRIREVFNRGDRRSVKSVAPFESQPPFRPQLAARRPRSVAPFQGSGSRKYQPAGWRTEGEDPGET